MAGRGFSVKVVVDQIRVKEGHKLTWDRSGFCWRLIWAFGQGTAGVEAR